MATYTNTGSSTNLDDALGNPTLGGSDIVRINEAGDSYSDGLTDLGTTAIAEFYLDPGFNGDVGNGTDAQVIQAGDMYLKSSSPNSVALQGVGSGTVALMHIEMLTAARVMLKNYTITKLRGISSGLVTIYGNTEVTSAYLGKAGQAMKFLAGTAMTLLTVAPGCTAYLERDCVTVKNHGGTVLCQDATATPETVESIGGRTQLLSGTVTITSSGKTIIDLSKATGTLTITWIVLGDTTIMSPPEGVTWNEPTDAQILGGKVSIV